MLFGTAASFCQDVFKKAIAYLPLCSLDYNMHFKVNGSWFQEAENICTQMNSVGALSKHNRMASFSLHDFSFFSCAFLDYGVKRQAECCIENGRKQCLWEKQDLRLLLFKK